MLENQQKDIARRIEAAEMWFLGKNIIISWMEIITNEQVIERARVRPFLVKTVKKRQLKFVGHVYYRKDEIEKIVLLGKIDGKRSRDRQRLS